MNTCNIKSDIRFCKYITEIEDYLQSIIENNKVCIVYDKHTYKYCRLNIKNAFEIILNAGEKYKNLTSINKIYCNLLDNAFTKSDTIIAIGGGVITDICGFAAMTYKRGMRLINIPTSVMAMADASIGGKNAIDINNIKNAAGGFYYPEKIIICDQFIDSLPSKQIINGLAEVIKMKLIFDDFDVELNNSTNCLFQAIHRSAELKQQLCEADAYDLSLRHVLNFGHTIGHAVEAASQYNLLHGEAILIGMEAEFNIGRMLNRYSNKKYKEYQNLLSIYNIDLDLNMLYNYDIAHFILNDKKCSGNVIDAVFITDECIKIEKIPITQYFEAMKQWITSGLQIHF